MGCMIRSCHHSDNFLDVRGVQLLDVIGQGGTVHRAAL